jgi:hypothetical protein
MRYGYGILFGLLITAGTVRAQDAGYADAYSGPGSVGSNEPLFRYDDQERWKHGWVRNMPYYEGYHSFRPYNYHNVFGQSQTSVGWGMPATMPYSQQFWHRYEEMVDMSRGDHSPLAPYVAPPQEWDHYPKPIRPGAAVLPGPAEQLRSFVPPDIDGPVPATTRVVPAQDISVVYPGGPDRAVLMAP